MDGEAVGEVEEVEVVIILGILRHHTQANDTAQEQMKAGNLDFGVALWVVLQLDIWLGIEDRDNRNNLGTHSLETGEIVARVGEEDHQVALVQAHDTKAQVSDRLHEDR